MGIVGNGKWIYREHCDMIRGLVPKERLLEWSVEQSWEPICRFLQKEVPDEAFPKRNNAAAFHSRVDEQTKSWVMQGLRNVGVVVVALSAFGIGLRWL